MEKGIRELQKQCYPSRKCLTCNLAEDCICPNSRYRKCTKEEKEMIKPWLLDE